MRNFINRHPLVLWLLILAVFFIPMFTLCGCTAEPSDVEQQEIPEKIYDENAMLVKIGDTVTIDGVTWTASMMYVTSSDNFYTDGYDSYFAVNRVNKHIYYIQTAGGSKYGSSWAIDTGLVYEGDIAIKGIVIPDPTN